MKKKQLSVLLIISILISVFALGGCYSDDNGASKTESAASETSEKTKIYFDSSTGELGDFDSLTFSLYEHKTLGYDNTDIIPWGSKKGKMQNEGNGMWSYDLKANGIELDSDKLYGCVFSADRNRRTSDLIIGEPCLGDKVYCTGNCLENVSDSNQKTYEVRWANADNTIYGIPTQITSLGNVVGNVYWSDETAYSLVVDFIANGLENAVKLNGKTMKDTIESIAEILLLHKSDIRKAVNEAGRTDLEKEILGD